MTNTKDQMQDVFPISFEIVKGEMPTGAKLTGWIKQTDSGFARMTRAIGDPWEYSGHVHGDLSPERLAQASLARVIGPSDYISPRGSSFQEPVSSTIRVRLDGGKNVWNLGFPLVKLSSDWLPTDGTLTKVQDLVWDVDIILESAPSGYFTSLTPNHEDLNAQGSFYVNYETGTIHTYDAIPSSVYLQISNIHMFGPGVPWGTSNIIPHWDSSILCNVATITSGGGTTQYMITLPEVASNTRINSPQLEGLDATWYSTAYGYSAKHRLPISLTSKFSTGEEVPEGFMYVWDESSSRIVPLTSFIYEDAHSIKVVTPEGWLTDGATVRLITTGTSLAESVHYLNSVVRENAHNGISVGQTGDNLHYTRPLSHEDLIESYTGGISSSLTEYYKFFFRKSDYPTNPHPQYIHRAGYLEDDKSGNSANAMRGHLVFAGKYDDTITASGSRFPVGSGTSGGNMTSTYGLAFGGADDSSLNENARLSWEGGEDLDTWSTSNTPAVRLAFGADDLGAQPLGTERYGALVYTPWFGMPLHLRGHNTSNGEYKGAALGFDFGKNNELNYIKLMKASRSGSYDTRNQPARISQSVTSALDITPGLDDVGYFSRFAPEQIREFRFRGGSHNDNVRNADDGLGGSIGDDIEISHDVTSVSGLSSTYILPGEYVSDFRPGDTVVASGFSNAANNGTKTVAGVNTSGGQTTVSVTGGVVNETTSSGVIKSNTNEFHTYFTSPGVVGADFLNIYSNAIFFSDTGDGKTTSFTDRGANWLNTDSTRPTGIYFVPPNGSDGPSFDYHIYDSNYSASTNPLKVGDREGFLYESKHNGNFNAITEGSTAICAGCTDLYKSTLLSLSGGNVIIVDNDISLYNALTTASSNTVQMISSKNMRLYADNIAIQASESFDISCDNESNISCGDPSSLSTTWANINFKDYELLLEAHKAGEPDPDKRSRLKLNGTTVVLYSNDRLLLPAGGDIEISTSGDISLFSNDVTIGSGTSGDNIKMPGLDYIVPALNRKTLYIDSVTGQIGVSS